jgi:hypothetical protein
VVSLKSFLGAATAGMAAVFAAALMLGATPASAFPSSSPYVAADGTAKVDAQLKPRFGDLIHPRTRDYRYGRPSWSRWSRFNYNGYYGDGNYGCGGGSAYPQYPGGYPSQGGYPVQSGYPDQGGYPSQNGYPAPGGYPSDGFYQDGCQGGGFDQTYGGYGRPDWAWQPGQDFSNYNAPIISPIYGGSYGGVSYGGGLEHVTVDCRGEHSSYGRISEALSQLAPGGTLHLKGRGPACTETLQIDKPVIIEGDPPSAFPTEADSGPATLTAPPGSPCAVIDAGPKGGVEFRDVVIEAPHGGRSACLQTFSSAVALVRTTLRYTGESSAVYAQGGQLVFNDTEIDSSGYDAAIWSEDAAIAMRNVGLNTSSTGLDVRPGVGQGVFLDHVSIVGGGGFGADASQSAIIGRRSRGEDCKFKIENTRITGFRTGLSFERGLSVEINRVRIGHSRVGIAVDGARLHVAGSAIDAGDYGVYVYAGEAEIADTSIFSFSRYPIGSDPGAIVHDHGLSLYSDGCGGFHHDGWNCRRSHDLPGGLLRDEDGGPRHWGWSGY